MRWTMTRVFPEPAPEGTRLGPAGARTASRCWGLSPAAGSNPEEANPEQAQLVVFPLALDGVRDEDFAWDSAAAFGLRERGGRADRGTRQLLEVLLLEVLGPYSDLPLPLGMLFDGGGRLCCLYVGELDPELVLADARSIERAGRDALWPVPLTGGRWQDRAPRRNLEALLEYLRPRGRPGMCAELEAALAEETR